MSQDVSRSEGELRDSLAEKKARVLGDKRRGGRFWRVGAGMALMVVFAGLLSYYGREERREIPSGSVTDVLPEGSVRHPVALFDDGKARHFSHDVGNGMIVRYFVLRSPDGVLRAAFDACDVCWPAGKGYFQVADAMVCANCGKAFPSERISEVEGGCNPAPLRRSVRGDEIVFEAADLAKGRQYFAFGQRGGV